MQTFRELITELFGLCCAAAVHVELLQVLIEHGPELYIYRHSGNFTVFTLYRLFVHLVIQKDYSAFHFIITLHI